MKTTTYFYTDLFDESNWAFASDYSHDFPYSEIVEGCSFG